MAGLYKKPVVITDPKTRKKVKTKSKKWWGRYKDEFGRENRVPLATDKAAAQTMFTQFVHKAERKAAGMIDPFDEHTNRDLLDHLKNYRRHLESKANADTHVKQTESYIKKILVQCSFKTIRNFSSSRVAI